MTRTRWGVVHTAGVRGRLLAATAIFLCIIGSVAGAKADEDFSGYEPYPISTNPDDWTVDRNANGFENVGRFEGRDDVLRLGIEPPADDKSFYRWEGYSQKTAVPAGDSFLRGDLWIADGWQRGTEAEFIHTGMWGSAMPENLVAKGDYVDAATVFPIVHFTNENGVGRLVVWDTTANPSGGWVDLPETAGLINYEGWNTIDLRLLPKDRKVQYLINGEVFYTWDMPMPDDPEQGAPEQFFAMYLKARNNGDTTFDSNWSRLMSGLLIRAGEAVTDTDGDVLVDPSGGTGQTVVANNTNIGGSVMSEGGSKGTSVAFAGGATVGGNVIGNNTMFQFSPNSEDDTYIGGNVVLEGGSSSGGGSQDNPIQVTGNVDVDNTSTLGGNWSVGGNLMVGGGLSPGNSIGTVTVTGNHTFGPSSTYDVEVNANGDADLLDVTGTASLDGTVRVTPLDGPDDFLIDQPYTIVTADGGFGGSQFDGARWSSSSAFLTPLISYDASNVYVTIERSDTTFASVAATSNQAGVAEGLESLSSANAAYTAVALSSAEEARSAFDALSGEIHASTRSALLDESRYLRAALIERTRMASISNGDVGPMDARVVSGTSANMWMRGFGSWGELEGDSKTAKVDRDTSGFVLGVDGAFSEAWQLGFAVGYSLTSLDTNSRSSEASVDSYHAAVYGGTSFGQLGLRLGAAHSWHAIETDRSIGYSGYSDTASVDYHARTAQIFGEVGYDIDLAGLELEPFGGLSYVHLDSDSFSENGGDAALEAEGGSDSLGFSTLGLRAAKSFELGKESRIAVQGALGWRHGFGDVSPSADLAFKGGASFAVTGAPIARDAAVVEAGVALIVAPNVSVGAAYTGQLASETKDHGVTANLTLRF